MTKEEKLLAHILDPLRSYLPRINETHIREAYEFAKEAHKDQIRESGDSYISHPLSVALLLTDYKADEDTIIAAILHDTVEDLEHISYQTIEKKFGTTIAKLVEGVTKISADQLKASLREESSLKKPHDVETIRKMFLESDRDIRVILIKLADRLHNMQTLGSIKNSAKRRAKAEETLNIFMPVAMRLGIWRMKNALETEVLHHLYPAQEEKIQTFLEKTKSKRYQLIQRLIYKIEKGDEKQKIQKIHVYQRSLFTLKILLDYEKELHPGRTFNLFICLKNEEACYTTLKLIHRLFPTRTLEEDFISNPRENGYKAYHINIVTHDGHKVQLRLGTEEMYLRSMYGIAYAVFQKKSEDSKARFLIPLELLSKKTKHSPEEFLEAAKSDLLQEKIEVHCEKKHHFIPEGSTAMDAIFHIYGHKALHTTEIFLNNKSIPFNQEITKIGVLRAEFSPRLTVEFDWFYKINTANARIAIQEALQKWNHEKKVEVGREILQKEFDLYGKGSLNTFLSSHRKKIKDEFHLLNENDFFVALGEGVIKTHEIFEKFFPERRHRLWGMVDKMEDFLSRLFFHRKKSSLYFQIMGIQEKEISIFQAILNLSKKFNIEISRNIIEQQSQTKMLYFRIRCHAPDQSALHNFIGKLEQQNGVIDIKPKKTFSVLGEFSMLIILWGTLWGFFLQSFYKILIHANISKPLVYGLIIPILIINFALYHFISNFFPSIRKSTVVFFSNFLMNFAAVAIYGYSIFIYQGRNLGFLSLLS